MRSDDIAPLLTPGGQPEFGFRQATVVSWNPATGSNVLNVSGTLVENLPMINLADAPNIRVGDVVAITRYRSTYFIAGRIVNAGASDFGTAATAFGSLAADNTGIGLTTGGNIVVQGTVDIPVWANTAALHVNAVFSAFNPGSTDDLLYFTAGTALAGDPIGYESETYTGFESGQSRCVANVASRIFTDIPPGTGSIRAASHVRLQNTNRGGVTWIARLDVSATFTRTRS